ncbi:MAG: toprim domain-containing protein, partial [Gemmatimonadaceae bacterium]|nr:toprim domain-containing protein [Gemmatimonadaceae bacterium]
SRGASGPDPREPLWEALAAAGEFFTRQLWEGAEAAAARDYWASRGLSRADADRYGAGYAPRDGAVLLAYLGTLGIDGQRAVEAGLAGVREGDATIRIRFRGRLMLPIRDVSGRVVGFGGRALGDDPPKYLNSPESTVFQKRDLLYHHDVARQAIRREERAIVVEGYFDALRCALAGAEAVVAPLGTALTEEQAQRLARYKVPVFLLYDSDEAGLKATFRAGLALLREGVGVRVATLPEGDDPDTFVRTHGSAGLERLLADAIDLFDRQVQLLERRGWFTELHLKRKAIDKLLPTIRATTDALTRELYLSRLSDVSGIDRGLLQREAEATSESRALTTRHSGDAPVRAADDVPPPPDDAPPSEGAVRKWAPRPRGAWQPRGRRRGPMEQEWLTTESPPPPPRIERAIASAERTLVRVLWHRRELIEQAAERRGPDMLHGEAPRAIFAALFEHADAPRETLLEQLDVDALGYAEALSAEDGDLEDAPQMLVDALRKLEQFDLEAQIDELERARTIASPEERATIEATLDVLRADARALGGRWRRSR